MNQATERVGHSSDQPRCSTGKLEYPNKTEAQEFAQYLRQTYGAKLQSPYVCSECAQFHLSTTERTDA